MSSFQTTVPERGFYPSALPQGVDYVECSDPFYAGRKSTTRNYTFLSYNGISYKTLNVNTDKMYHRPSDIIDHMNRPRMAYPFGHL